MIRREDRELLERMRDDIRHALARPGTRSGPEGPLVYVSRERLERWARELDSVIKAAGGGR